MIWIAGSWATGVSRVSSSVAQSTTAPGQSPVVVAVFCTLPAFASASVTVCAASAVQVVDSPGASVVTTQVTAIPKVLSVTSMLSSVTLPVLETANPYHRPSPRVIVPELSLSS